MTIIRWDKAPYGIKAIYTDVAGMGRFSIRSQGIRKNKRYIVRLNGTVRATCMCQQSAKDFVAIEVDKKDKGLTT